MSITSRNARRFGLLLTTVLAAGALAACNAPQQPTAPPEAALTEAPVSTALAPDAEALPPATVPVARVADRRASYAYLDRAYAMNDAFGDTAPDYGFEYDGVSPWAWRTSDRALRLVERLSGGDRYYYYEPGSDYPFLVRDPEYAYGYDDGRLVVVYDRQGRPLDVRDFDQRADYGGRYLARARALQRAAEQDRRQAIAQNNWEQRRRVIQTENARLAEQQRQSADWRAYRQERPAQARDRWADERGRREAQAVQQQQQQQAAAAAAAQRDDRGRNRDQAGRDQAGRDQAGRDQAARDATERQRLSDLQRQQQQDAQRQQQGQQASQRAAAEARAQQANLDRARAANDGAAASAAGVAKVEALNRQREAAAREKAQAQAQKKVAYDASVEASRKGAAAHQAIVDANAAQQRAKKAEVQQQQQARAQAVAAQKAQAAAQAQQRNAELAKARAAQQNAKAAAARERPAPKPSEPQPKAPQ